MATRSRKPNIKSNRKNERREVAPAPATDGRHQAANGGTLPYQRRLIGTVAALTAATLILNGDGLTFEGDNIL
ncbi:MAG: hypothetical protein FWD31_06940, partial [Planctomycetaceae bacterium]|nr:hypothetical protein [Planctomycetaceae bacterium]